jgi:Predicted symporter
VVLGIAFEKQNIAFMVSLAFAIAASANFPVLFMSVLWKDCTTRGAVIGGFMGLISSVGLTIVSPSVWEATLGNPVGSALFPYTSPALFSMTIGFVGIWLFSITDKSANAARERAAFPAQQVRSETGFGAAGLRATDPARYSAHLQHSGTTAVLHPSSRAPGSGFFHAHVQISAVTIAINTIASCALQIRARGHFCLNFANMQWHPAISLRRATGAV